VVSTNTINPPEMRQSSLSLKPFLVVVALLVSVALWKNTWSHDTSQRLKTEARRSDSTDIFASFPFLVLLAEALLDESEHTLLSKVEAPQRLECLGQSLLLTQHIGDDSIQRLTEELSGLSRDTYGIKKITSESPLLLDVGGNIGFVSVITSLLHPKSQVVVFEPSPLTYFFLRVNLALNNIHVLTSEELQNHPTLPGVYPVHGGVGASAPLEFASMADPKRVEKQSQNGIVDLRHGGDVPVYNLGAFLQTHGLISRVFDVVKLDCECCEYYVIPDNSAWILDRTKVKSLTGEIHGCGHTEHDTEKKMLAVLRERGCEFRAANFRKEDGRFQLTANLNDNCT